MDTFIFMTQECLQSLFLRTEWLKKHKLKFNAVLLFLITHTYLTDLKVTFIGGTY